MKKIMEYIKNNKIFVIILLIGLILLGIQLNQVIMYADDYTLGIFSNKDGFKGAWDYFVYNYFHWGGGWTGLIVISILTIGFKSWLVIELLLMLAIILITIKFIHLKDGKYKELILLLVWLLYFIINIHTSRETIYWLDGSMAYVFTTFQVILYTYLIYTRMHYPNMRKKYDYIIFPLSAFFGGWSAAQSGAIVVLISIIVWVFAKFVNKEKIPKFYLYSSVLTLIGYCIFFFAPGNSSRMSTTEMFASLDVFSKMLYKVNDLYGLLFDFKSYSYFGLQFFTYFVIVLLLLVIQHIVKNEKNEKIKFFLSISCVYNFVFLLLLALSVTPFMNNSLPIYKLFIYNNIYNALSSNTFSIVYLIPYFVATIVMLIMVIQALYISIKSKNSLLLILIVSGLATQVVMLMAPYTPYRTTLMTITLFIASIGYLFKYILDNDIKWEYLVSTMFLIKYFPLGVILLLTFYASNTYLKDNKIIKLKNINIIIFMSFLSLLALYNWAIITINYRDNKAINEENMIRIEKYKENPTSDKILVLIAPKDELYGFTPLANNDWVEADVKKYFDLDKDTDIMFEEEYEEYLNKSNNY